jgi:hypothetical protein
LVDGAAAGEAGSRGSVCGWGIAFRLAFHWNVILPKAGRRFSESRSAHGKNGPNSLRRSLIFDVQTGRAAAKVLFTLAALAGCAVAG